MTNRQTVTLLSGQTIHDGSLILGDYLYISTQTQPAKLLKVNIADLTYTVLTFDADSLHHISASLAYDPGSDRILVAFTTLDLFGVFTKVISKVNPSDISTYTDFIFDDTVTVVSTDTIVLDSTHLYVVTSSNPSQIRKYLLSDASLVGTLTLTGRGGVHCLALDDKLYFGGSNPAWVGWAEKDLSAWDSVNLLASGTNSVEDDMCVIGTKLWLSLNNSSDLKRVSKDLATIDTVTTSGTSTPNGMAVSAGKLWVCYASSPSKIVCVDPVTLAEIGSLTMQTGENSANEILPDGSRMIVTFSTNPRKIARIYPYIILDWHGRGTP